MSRFVVRMMLRPVTECSVESEHDVLDVVYSYMTNFISLDSGTTFIEIKQDEMDWVIYMLVTEREGPIAAIACDKVTREEALHLINHGGGNN